MASETVKCGEVAVNRIYWPGKPPLASCPHHLAAALGIANVLGMYLHFDNCELTTCGHAGSVPADTAPAPTGTRAGTTPEGTDGQ